MSKQQNDDDIRNAQFQRSNKFFKLHKDLPPSERPDALRAAEQPVKSLLNEMKEKNSSWAELLEKIKRKRSFTVLLRKSV